ncbi:hypothetical protein SH2C18_51070 [Clostridium sediminicola]
MKNYKFDSLRIAKNGYTYYLKVSLLVINFSKGVKYVNKKYNKFIERSSIKELFWFKIVNWTYKIQFVQILHKLCKRFTNCASISRKKI